MPRWVVKAPSHLSALPLLFSTYPDAVVVITHRDPLRVIGSLADLMATLHFMHSDHVDHEVLIQFMAMGLELQMDEVAKERDAVRFPTIRIADVVYRDLVADPVGVIELLYAAWDLEVTAGFRTRLDAYLSARHTGLAVGGHDYSFADTGLDLAFHRVVGHAVPGAFRGAVRSLIVVPRPARLRPARLRLAQATHSAYETRCVVRLDGRSRIRIRARMKKKKARMTQPTGWRPLRLAML